MKDLHLFVVLSEVKDLHLFVVLSAAPALRSARDEVKDLHLGHRAGGYSTPMSHACWRSFFE